MEAKSHHRKKDREQDERGRNDPRLGKLVLAVDPGFSGSLVLYAPMLNKIVSFLDMPTFEQDGRKQINLKKIVSWAAVHADLIEGVFIESVHAMPGNGVSSMFRFGFYAGAIEGIFVGMGLDVYKLEPSVWKTILKLSSVKKESIDLAYKLFSKDKEKFLRAKDDGRAEAALMAYLGGLMLKEKSNGC